MEPVLQPNGTCAVCAKNPDTCGCWDEGIAYLNKRLREGKKRRKRNNNTVLLIALCAALLVITVEGSAIWWQLGEIHRYQKVIDQFAARIADESRVGP